MKKTSVTFLAALLSAVMLLTACGNPEGGDGQNGDDLTKSTVKATITLESGDEIDLELYPDLAPETVENFVELAEDGFYDGTIFHRVIEDFVIQGGGYNENLREQKTKTIKGEFAENNFENNLKHERGVISMARLSRDVNSATSQFFICLDDLPDLDGKYAAFGRVTDGMDVVDEIASERTGTVAYAGLEDVPVDPIVIESITISSSKSSKSSNKSSRQSDDEDETDDSSSGRSSTKKSTAAPSPTPRSLPNMNDYDDIDDFDDEEERDTSRADIPDDEEEPIAHGLLPTHDPTT